MNGSADIPGWSVPLHRSLTEPILLGGVPRQVVSDNMRARPQGVPRGVLGAYRRAPRLFAELATARGEGRLPRMLATLERPACRSSTTAIKGARC